MKKTILLSIVSATLLISCKDTQVRERQISKADWLLGSWINATPNGNLSEHWQKENDSVYRGRSFFIKKTDTIHSESITLTELNGELFYSPTVQGQNGNKPADFKMSAATAQQLVFENPAHDFPQKITHTKVANDSLGAETSGMQHGKPASEKFAMRRLQ